MWFNVLISVRIDVLYFHKNSKNKSSKNKCAMSWLVTKDVSEFKYLSIDFQNYEGKTSPVLKNETKCAIIMKF